MTCEAGVERVLGLFSHLPLHHCLANQRRTKKQESTELASDNPKPKKERVTEKGGKRPGQLNKKKLFNGREE